MSEEVVVPRLGLTMEVGILTQWLVQDGERVEVDQPIAEIATDKIEHEMLAPVAGTIADLHATDDEEELPVGTVIARITP